LRQFLQVLGTADAHHLVLMRPLLCAALVVRLAFLTCDPNSVVAPIHPAAMPVILTEPEEWARWLATPWEIARALQRTRPDGLLQVAG
jgi:putative SOS response-associated peptidase YedK